MNNLINRSLQQQFSVQQPTRTRVASLLLALSMLLIPTWRVWAAPGDLDTSFSGDGRYSAFPYSLINTEGTARFFDVRTQSDGKIVAASTYNTPCTVASEFDFTVVRVTASGAKDKTFGVNGMAGVKFNNFPGVVSGYGKTTALELLSNGKILVAGSIDTCNKVGLARLQSDGSLDATFAGHGRVIADSYYSAQVSDIAVQSDGKIVLAGRKYVGLVDAPWHWEAALWRFNANGTPDTTFGTNGALTKRVWPETPLNASSDNESFNSIAIQTGDKLVVLSSPPTATGGYRLVRYLSNGTLDASFGSAGVFTSALGKFGNAVKALKPTLQVSVLMVVGTQQQGSQKYGALFAHTAASGTVNTSFGTGGQVVAAQTSEWNDVAVQMGLSAGKYVAVGRTTNSIFEQAVIVRYTGSGAPDASFGANGYVETTGFGLPQARYLSVRIDAEGRPVAAGFSRHEPGLPHLTGILARYLN